MKRSVKFDVFTDNKQVVIESIRLYRAACRKAYSACAIAEMAGAEIIEDAEKGIVIKPNNTAKEILEKTFGVSGKAHLYELRLWLRSLHPEWLSIVPESIHRDIVSPKWRGKDPEFPKATNGYLVLNGARSFGRFEHIGIPIKNTVPKMSKHSMFIKWDSEIGEVEFKLGRLDGGRHHSWKNVRDKSAGWKLGATYINERDGKIFLTMSYTAPDKEAKADSEKTLTIYFNDESKDMYINCEGSDKLQGDKISVTGIYDHLIDMQYIADRYAKQKESAGNPRRVWGSRKFYKAIQNRITNITKRRELFLKDTNHLWSRRIVDNARRWNCGTIVAVNMPEREMFCQPWNWGQFKFDLEYKAKEWGATVKYVTQEKQDAT